MGPRRQRITSFVQLSRGAPMPNGKPNESSSGEGSPKLHERWGSIANISAVIVSIAAIALSALSFTLSLKATYDSNLYPEQVRAYAHLLNDAERVLGFYDSLGDGGNPQNFPLAGLQYIHSITFDEIGTERQPILNRLAIAEGVFGKRELINGIKNNLNDCFALTRIRPPNRGGEGGFFIINYRTGARNAASEADFRSGFQKCLENRPRLRDQLENFRDLASNHLSTGRPMPRTP
jgi:hypothetical protein